MRLREFLPDIPPGLDNYQKAKRLSRYIIAVMLLHFALILTTIAVDLYDGVVRVDTKGRQPAYFSRASAPKQYWADIRERLLIAVGIDGGIIVFALLLPWLNRPRGK
jgi:hypothetical protein